MSKEPEKGAGGAPPLLGPARLLRILLGHAKPYAPRAALLVLTLLVEGAFNILLALSLKFIIDFAITPRDARLLALILGGLFAGSLLTAASQVGRDHLYAWLGSRVVGRVRGEMFRHLQRLSPGFYARSRVGDLSARFSSDLNAIENAVVLGIPGALLCVINIVFSACVLFALDWRLALVAAAGLPLCVAGPNAAMWRRQAGTSLSPAGDLSVTDVGILRDVPLFKDLEHEYLRDISEMFITEHVPAGRVVIEEGEEGRRFYIVARQGVGQRRRV